MNGNEKYLWTLFVCHSGQSNCLFARCTPIDLGHHFRFWWNLLLSPNCKQKQISVEQIHPQYYYIYRIYYLEQYWSLLNWQNLRLRCGCVAVPVNWFFDIFHHVLLNLRTLYIVWSLVRRRVTRRLIRLQTMFNVLKYRKNTLKRCVAVAVRLRLFFSIYLKPVLYI